MPSPTSADFYSRISCKLKLGRLVFLVAIYSVSCLTTVNGTSKQEGHNVYNGNIPSGVGVTQRISILIGGNAMEIPNIAHDNRAIGLYQDDGSGGGSRNSSGTISETTSWNMCRQNSRSRCCYQYTWPGFQSTIPESPSNATCEYLRMDRQGDDSFPCFDPLVFTEPVQGSDEPLGTPPDFSVLTARARLFNWNIFCPMTDKSCVKVTYYARTGNNRITNETRFCGVVTNSNNGEQLQNGCYRQKVDGYTREVCVCSGHLCNSPSNVLRQSTVVLGILFGFSLALRNIMCSLM